MLNNFYPFGRYHLTERNFYSLDDLVEERFRNNFAAAKSNHFSFNTLFDEIGSTAFTLNSTEMNTLLQDYIWPKYHDEFIFYIDGERNSHPIQTPEAKKVIGNIIAWLNESALAYTKELEVYTSIENDLLKQLGSSTTTKFNDTPQVNGDVSTDPYITNLTTTESKTDSGTPLEKLKEVRDSIRNVYEAWSKEFRKFVIYN